MTVIDQLLEKVRAFRKDIKRRAVSVVYEGQEQEMIRLQINQMLVDGIRNDGSQIEPPYTQYTINTKIAKDGSSAIVDHVTLRDTGEFHEGIYIRKTANQIRFYSSDSKSSKLQGKYGEDIFGLTDENLNKVLSNAKDNFIRDFKRAISI